MIKKDDLDQGNSSQKILRAAIDEFTEFGFEGARVARIAKKAGVSQALLYYNFDSKQAILDEILNNFFKSNVNLFKDNTQQNEDAPQSIPPLKDELQKSLNYILENHKEVKILLLQTLIESQGDKRILTMFGDLNKVTRKKALNHIGYELNDAQQPDQTIIDYFFIFIPFIMFGLLGREWGQINNIPIEKVMTTLTEVTDSLYKTYLK